MSFYKWKKMYENYKAMHNFEVRKSLFELEEDNEIKAVNNIVYF